MCSCVLRQLAGVQEFSNQGAAESAARCLLGRGADNPVGRAGTWQMTYVDDSLRILYTNRGNVFALERIPESKLII